MSTSQSVMGHKEFSLASEDSTRPSKLRIPILWNEHGRRQRLESSLCGGSRSDADKQVHCVAIETALRARDAQPWIAFAMTGI